MKSNSFMGGAALTTSRRLTQIFADKTQTLLGSPPPFLSVLVRAHPRQEFLDSRIAPPTDCGASIQDRLRSFPSKSRRKSGRDPRPAGRRRRQELLLLAHW